MVLTRFWWDAKEGENKISWVSWDKLTLPKRLGGLGFRDIQAFNQALLAKIAWRIITKPTCLLSRILGGKYCSTTSFLKVESVSSSSSHSWKGILKVRDLLLTHRGKALGDEESTNVWRDSWICPESDLKPYGPVREQDQDLLVSDLLSRETKEWNREKVENLLPELASHILALRPSKLGAQDSFVWKYHKSGAYTAKSGYISLQETKVQSTISLLNLEVEGWSWNKHIWSTNLLPKIKMFLWKVGQNALPTVENLIRRGIVLPASCSRCGEPETTLHLLFHCQFARQVWDLCPWSQQINLSQTTSFKEALITSGSWISLPPFGFTSNIFPWFLWTSRNRLIFEKKAVSAADVFLQSVKAIKEWDWAQSQIAKPPVPLSISPAGDQRSPNSQTIFCNSDAAWRSDTMKAGLAWIFMEHDGREINRGSHFQEFVSSACMAEALEIRITLLHAAALLHAIRSALLYTTILRILRHLVHVP